MSLSLDERVKAFHDNPHPPQLVWLETAYLISDLWKEIQRLQKSTNNSDLFARSIQADMGAENERLRKELDQTRIDAANVVHALDAAVQLIEMLIAFTPEGSSLHPDVAGAKNVLDQALTVIGVRKP